MALSLAEVLADIDKNLEEVKTAEVAETAEVLTKESGDDDEDEAVEAAPEGAEAEEADSDDEDEDEDKDEDKDKDEDEDKEASDVSILKAIQGAIDETEKVAESIDPVSDLMKLAEEINEREFDGLLKKAELLSTAMADGIIARLQSYEKVASDLQHEETINVLNSTQDQLKLAAEQGYADTYAQMEKVANDLYTTGYTKTASMIAGVTLFEKGAQAANEVINVFVESAKAQ